MLLIRTVIYVVSAVWYNSIPFQDRSNPIDTEKYPASLGITLELCAGIIDKDKSIEEIAREEVLEECGYDVPLKNLKQIKKYRYRIYEYI